MPNYIESKKEEVKKPLGSKTCLHCGSTRFLDKFLNNRDWKLQNGKDLWCLECLKKCSNREELRRYFWLNKRQWSDQMWDNARKKALSLIGLNPTYVKSSLQRKNSMLDKMTISMIPSYLNLPMYYKFIETGDLTYDEAKEQSLVPLTVDPYAKKYNPDWDGSFTSKLLLFLNNYYAKLLKDFSFTDASTIDYAKKVCRASMQVDKAMDDFANGRCDYASVKDAVNVFDMLSKSANLAACKRRELDTVSANTWSLTTLYLLTHGYPMTELVTYPQDDIDRINENFRHVIAAIGIE